MLTKSPMRPCVRCQTAYLPTRSTAELRLSYCCQMCQVADIGVCIRDLLSATRQPSGVAG